MQTRFICFFVGLLLLPTGRACPQPVDLEWKQDGFTIRNRFLQRTVSTEPHLRTVSVKNMETGTEFRMESDEFLIALDEGKTLLTTRDFVPAGKPVGTELPGAGREVSCRLTNAQHGLNVEITYQIKGEADFWTRKWIRLDSGARLVNWIEVERFRFIPGPGAALELKRFDQEKMPFFMQPWDVNAGRPIYAGREMFLGLEYPAGRNEFDKNGTISLRHYPGRSGAVTSRTAVIGFAPDRPCERVNDRFLEYVDRIRVRPVKRTVQWIAYFNVGVSDELALEKMNCAKRTFADRGVRLDCVLMDSGWTDGKSIMRISPTRPDRPGQIRNLAREYLNTGLGLHVITSGVKPMVDKDWLAQQGYDLIWHKSARDGAYCMADPRVEKEFESNLVQYVKDYDIVAYKFDWGYFACPQAGHRGHLPGVEYGLEANTDAFIKVLQGLREAKPDIFLFNTGWYSPWWLLYYDAVFSAGADYNFSLSSPPAFATCSALGTWRDAVVRGNLVLWSPYFPLSSLMHHSPTSHWWHDWNCRYKDPLDRFADHVLMSYLRGSQMTEIGLNIAALTDDHRDVLASIMNWAARHDDVLLAGARFLSGDPLKGEVYGSAHFSKDGRGLIGLKNPHVIPQTVEIKLGEECGLRPTQVRHRLRTLYPYRAWFEPRPGWGDLVSVKLQGQEVLVIEVLPETAAPDGYSPSRPKGVEGKVPEIREAQAAPSESAIQGRIRLAMPTGLRGALVLLADRPKLTATVSADGKEVEAEAPHIQVEDSKEPARTYGGKTFGQRDKCGWSIKGNWSLFRVPLHTGENDVRFTVSCADLDLIRLPASMKDGPLPTTRSIVVPFRGMVQTEEDLPQTGAARQPGELTDRWANVLRRSVDVVASADVKLESRRRFEIYTIQKGANAFTDTDVKIVSIPAELIGCKGIRFSKAQAARDASLPLALAKPMRVIAAFAKGQGVEGYLAPPPGWDIYAKDCFESTDPLLGRDLYMCDLPKGETILFPSMRGACLVLAVSEQPPNLAQGRPVLVQSSHNSAFLPAHVTDGDVRTEWWSQNGLPQWAVVDLGEEKSINCVQIVFYHKDERSYQYKIETSRDGKEWQTACDATRNEALSTERGARHFFATRPARFVRVTVTGGSRRVQAAHICELGVYGDNLAPR